MIVSWYVYTDLVEDTDNIGNLPILFKYWRQFINVALSLGRNKCQEAFSSGHKVKAYYSFASGFIELYKQRKKTTLEKSKCLRKN